MTEERLPNNNRLPIIHLIKQLASQYQSVHGSPPHKVTLHPEIFKDLIDELETAVVIFIRPKSVTDCLKPEDLLHLNKPNIVNFFGSEFELSSDVLGVVIS